MVLGRPLPARLDGRALTPAAAPGGSTPGHARRQLAPAASQRCPCAPPPAAGIRGGLGGPWVWHQSDVWRPYCHREDPLQQPRCRNAATSSGSCGRAGGWATGREGLSAGLVRWPCEEAAVEAATRSFLACWTWGRDRGGAPCGFQNASACVVCVGPWPAGAGQLSSYLAPFPPCQAHHGPASAPTWPGPGPPPSPFCTGAQVDGYKLPNSYSQTSINAAAGSWPLAATSAEKTSAGGRGWAGLGGAGRGWAGQGGSEGKCA